jgi:hypothetical protein
LRRRSALITLGRRMWSISVGSGGTGPLVITHRPEPAGLSSGLRPSASTVESPVVLSRPKISCWRGRRRSASSTIVGMPMLANAIARLATTVDLPCSGSGLVISITRVDSSIRNSRFVRRAR